MNKKPLRVSELSKPGSRFGIFRRLLFTSISITIIPIIIIGIYTSNIITKIGDDIGERTTIFLNKKTIDLLEMQAELTAKSVEKFLLSVENDLDLVANTLPQNEAYLNFILNMFKLLYLNYQSSTVSSDML